MKKDLDWLRRKVLDNKFTGHTIHIDVLFELMDELDGLEILSQEWIDKNTVYADVKGGAEAFLNIDSVKNLLVPKQDVLTDEQIARKVDQAYKDGYEKGKEHAAEKQTEETETVAGVLVDYLIASAKLKLALSMEVEELEK